MTFITLRMIASVPFFLACLQTASTLGIAADQNSINNMTLADTEADFLRWVSVVSSRSHSKTTTDPLLFPSAVITVSNSGNADFTTVQAAVNAVPTHNTERITIQIDSGIYQEKVNIPKNKPFITFLGTGSDLTTITWHDTASSSGSTFNSASVAINSDSFIARGISFKNSAPAPPPGAAGRQAVALRISGDKAAFYNCNFYGAQDTLYDHAGRHYFRQCFIQGSIDFIFGDGQSLYESCELHSIATTSGSLTAQNRKRPGENTGFSFVNCKVTGSGMIYLGRAWGSYSRVVFSHTYIDKIKVPAGWNDFGQASRQKTAFYGEYECSGPGANAKGKVAWSHQLTESEAAPFQSISFVDGASWVHTT